MALQSMTALASITLQQASASVSFSGIPQNYRDLVLVMTLSAGANSETRASFNGDDSSSYSWVQMGGPIVSNSGTFTAHPFNPNSFTSTSSPDLITFNIFDYSSTDKHKSSLSRYNPSNSANIVNAIAGRWVNTNAIISINIFATANQFNAGSTFNLYGRIA